eukprot:6854696-Alexandrium_andersonii.AAC.1
MACLFEQDQARVQVRYKGHALGARWRALRTAVLRALARTSAQPLRSPCGARCVGGAWGVCCCDGHG